MRFLSILGIALLISLNIQNVFAEELPLQEKTNSAIFKDVEPGNRNYVPIKFLKEKGCIKGYADETFKPYEEISRAEAITMIMRCVLTEEVKTESAENPFIDVPNDQWYFPYVLTAYQKKIISGYEDKSFMPDKKVNLAEGLAMVIRTLDLTPDLKNNIDLSEAPAVDVQIDSWYAPYIALAMEKFALFQSSNGEVFPRDPLLRGQLANILYRFLDRESSLVEYGNASFYAGRFQGQRTAFGNSFNNEMLTAAHRKLPFGSLVEVTNLYNGKTVKVEIDDRGPYVPGRIIDLSRSAFETLDYLGRGVIQVKIELISMP